MANSAQARKRARQAVKQGQHNASLRSELRTAIKKVTKAIAKILHAAGVNFAILGEEETCTGDSARRAGNEYLFQMIAESWCDRTPDVIQANACRLRSAISASGFRSGCRPFGSLGIRIRSKSWAMFNRSSGVL